MNKTSRLFAAALAAVPAATLAAGTSYTLDPAHTFPSFEADHMGISVWRGKMDSSKGSAVIDRAAGTGTVEVTIDLKSIDFGLEDLNKWARGEQFFDVDRFPTATYQGTLTDFVNGAPTRATGRLTLHGVTRPLDLKLNSFRCIPHPMLKREYCGADAFAVFDRSDYGLAAGKEWGFKMDVTLRIQAEALADP